MTTPYVPGYPLIVRGQNDIYGWIFQWAFTGSDVGQPIPPDFTAYIDRSVQVSATGITWEGSNDGISFATLNDPFGNPLVITSASIHGVTEAVAYARPNNTGGGAVTVTVMARRGLR
jgi:hypothetical protein